MDLENLLDEVEGAMQSPRSSRSSTGAKASNIASSVRSNQATHKPRNASELDDLLDMFDDRDNEPAAVHPRPTSSSRTGSAGYSTVKSCGAEFQAGGMKKCSQALMDGGRADRGLNTGMASRNVCANLRCNECDFTVVQFPGKKWDASADYMFFRENVPSEVKLRVKMEVDPAFAAYACQCKWLSIDMKTRVDRCRVKWSCAGH